MFGSNMLAVWNELQSCFLTMFSQQLCVVENTCQFNNNR